MYIFAGGGSGGHLYPGISVAQFLSEKQPEAEIVFLCTRRAIDKKILESFPWRVVPQPITPLPKNPLLIPKFLLNWYQSCSLTEDLCSESDGRVAVCGLGGFASGAALKTAQKLKVPTAMLNPDAVPGKANKFCQKYADRIFVQWEETVGSFGKNADICQVTGCPVRRGYWRNVGELSPESLYTKELLVFGGSLGGHNVNVSVVNAIKYLYSRYPQIVEDWKILHISGEKDFEMVRKGYAELPLKTEVISYCDNMDVELKKASLVVCRAGASTLAELTSIGVGSILLPYPYHKDKHQQLNAEILSKKAAAVIVEDTTDNIKTASWLVDALKDCMDIHICYEMAIAAKNIGRSHAAETIATELAVMF